MIELRPFQADAKDDVMSAWNDGAKNVLLVIPTGGGKTVVFSDIIANHPGPCIAIAHRQEIVSQISLSLARNGVRHRIVGPTSVAKACTQMHMIELKRNYVDPSNRVIVAGVDTLARMRMEMWMDEVTLVVMDEAHHVLRKNKWGKALGMFVNAKCLGVTATPCRADGNGLGRHADGLMDYMIEGPTTRELINENWLTEYRIFAPPSDVMLDDVPLSEAGDFSPVKLAVAVHKSHIVGDVVTHYSRIAPGKLGITFAVDVVSATEIAGAYRQAGITSEVVSAKTPDMLRSSILRKFRNREVLQLVNVDLFGEGFDLPAIEVVSMARPTASLGLYLQQFGRSLRPMKGKTHAIIIDHVSNVHRHGLPDSYRCWSLDRRERRDRGNVEFVIPTRTCPECTAAYERVQPQCPYCGYKPEPANRSSPEFVDGDLSELSADALEKLRGQIDKQPVFPYSARPEVIGHLKKVHREKQEAQIVLRETMSLWGGKHTSNGDTVSVAQRRFFHMFGIDVATAQTLNKKEALELMEKIK